MQHGHGERSDESVRCYLARIMARLVGKKRDREEQAGKQRAEADSPRRRAPEKLLARKPMLENQIAPVSDYFTDNINNQREIVKTFFLCPPAARELRRVPRRNSPDPRRRDPEETFNAAEYQTFDSAIEVQAGRNPCFSPRCTWSTPSDRFKGEVVAQVGAPGSRKCVGA